MSDLLKCVECASPFVLTDGEEAFLRGQFGPDYKPPRRCRECRKRRKRVAGAAPSGAPRVRP